MPPKKTFENNGVTYGVSIDELQKDVKFQITNPDKHQIPEFLNKLYSLSENSVDAFENHFLFASHPVQLNDKYDSAAELIDYSSADLKYYLLNLTQEMQIMTVKSVTELFHSDRKYVLDRTLTEINQLRLYMKFGVISMSENSLDMHMWGYYANNNGFLLKFDTKLLPSTFNGPFPINYVSELKRINFFEYEMGIPILYQSNVKHISWKSENEWRYLAYSIFGDFIPFFSKSNINTRKFYFNPKAISEIILGYDFFTPLEIDYEDRTKEFEFIDLTKEKSKKLKDLKSRILKTIIKNDYPTSIIIRHINKYQLGANAIKIEQISPYKFKLIKISDKVRLESTEDE